MAGLSTTHPKANPYSGETGQELNPTHRLVVLVPCQEADLAAGTQRVWEIANRTRAHVILLGLCGDPARESSLRRRLATMSALVSSGSVTAESEILSAGDWAEAVKARWQAGDMLVCLAEDGANLAQEPLRRALEPDMNLPLTVLPGLTIPAYRRPTWLSRSAAWGGLLAIVLIFCLLQAGILLRVKSGMEGWMLLSVALEYGLISIWNRRFG